MASPDPILSLTTDRFWPEPTVQAFEVECPHLTHLGSLGIHLGTVQIRRAIPILSIALAVAASGVSQAQSYSEPENNYLHEIVQKWTEHTSVGNLRDAKFDDTDIEVRIWAGFGLRGSSGAVLRRTGDKWSVIILDLDRYFAGGSNEIAAEEGLLPPCIVDAMRDRCVIETSFDSDGNPEFYGLDCVLITPSPRHNVQQALAELWSSLESLGVRELPLTIERDWVMMDGHSYVIEVRVGSSYRATVTEHAYETEADEQIHKIVMAFDSVLDTWLFGGNDDS